MVRFRDTQQCDIQAYAGDDERFNPQGTKGGSIDLQVCHEPVDNFQAQRTLEFFLHDSPAEFLALLL